MTKGRRPKSQGNDLKSRFFSARGTAYFYVVVLCNDLVPVKGELSLRSPAWVQYRLGDVFKGTYRETHRPSMPKGSIAWAYSKRAQGKEDLAALDAAAREVCAEQHNNISIFFSHWKANSSTAAVHLRLGDVLLMQKKQLYLRFPPAEFYGFVGAKLAQKNFQAVTLFYSSGFRVSARHKARVEELGKFYVKTLSNAFKEYGVDTERARAGHADQHFCAMLGADVFIPSGGGYSMLAWSVRQRRGATQDLPYRWWCNISALRSERVKFHATPDQLEQSAKKCKARPPAWLEADENP
eukprot:m.44325 g.44325  ORF g.44325 m.44325 type:complete len:296 (-) comp8520_c0_seq1:44-931(-)